MTFTKYELESLNRGKLLRLCGYFGLSITSKMKKEDIIDIILKYLYPLDNSGEIVSNSGEQISVRVKRIKELNKS